MPPIDYNSHPIYLALSRERKRLGLLKESLKSKWNRDPENSGVWVTHMCPFCFDVNMECTECLCPPEICGNKSHIGYIREMIKYYLYITMNDHPTIGQLEKEHMDHMLQLFTDAIELTKKKISSLDAEFQDILKKCG